MREDEINLLDIQRGLVVAPAGCGKTHLIVETLKRHTCGKPTLVLTHTNAGVAALRGRLDRGGVLPSAYRLATIDGWAIRIISTFPKQAGLDPNLLNLANPRANYPSIRDAALSLLKAGHINDVLAAREIKTGDRSNIRGRVCRYAVLRIRRRECTGSATASVSTFQPCISSVLPGSASPSKPSLTGH